MGNTVTSFHNPISLVRKADGVLLLLLLLVCNQAVLAIKLAGFVVVYVLRPNFRLGLRSRRLPLFYVVAPLLGLATWAVYVRDDLRSYSVAFGVGALMWILCLLATHQVKLSLEQRGAAAVDATLKIFTILNLLCSLLQVVIIATRTNVLNPYSYDVPFPYGMSTGDHVFGVFGENSYYNMMVSAMLAIYFLFRKSWGYCLAATTSLLMVFSNIGTLLFCGVLVMLSLLVLLRAGLSRLHIHSGVLARVAPFRSVWWFGPLLIGYVVLFYALLSPQNFTYTKTAARSQSESPAALSRTSISSPTQRSTRLRDAVTALDFKKYSPGVHRSNKAHAIDLRRRQHLTRQAIAQMKGKKLAFLQTWAFLESGVRPALLGSGIGRFSSLTAHRISGGDSGRLFSRLPRYHTALYAENHGLITRYRLEAGGALLANLNWPESFYNQLFGEYGLIGLAAFLLFYVGHYLQRAGRWSWGWWVAALAVPFGVLSYLFEALCPIVFLEVLLELDAVQARTKIA